MTTFTYFPNVPNGPNDPADDQPNMLTNTQSVNGLIAVDHLGFNGANGGIHNIIHFSNQAGDPAISGTGQLFTKTVGSDNQLFYESSLGVVEQITGGSSSGAVGYVLLPGGFIMQWGNFTNAGSNNISFTPNFSAPPFYVNAVSNNNGAPSSYTNTRSFIQVTSQTTSGAVVNFIRSTGGIDSFAQPVQWLAIGKG